ncbi:hypothetical protein ACWDT5_12845 [Rhodococcus aetherivorans]
MFELQFAGHRIGTAGDWPDVLVATKTTEQYLRCRFAERAEIAEANVTAFHADYAFEDTTESCASRYEVATANLPEGRNRTVSENLALAYGLLIGARSAGRPLFLCVTGLCPRWTCGRDLRATSPTERGPSKPRTRVRRSLPRWVPPSEVTWL